MVWAPFLLRPFVFQEICERGRDDTQGGSKTHQGGPLSKRVPEPRKGLRTTWGSGNKGGQGWGETPVITIVILGAGYSF